jgi:hypothetical protein
MESGHLPLPHEWEILQIGRTKSQTIPRCYLSLCSVLYFSFSDLYAIVAIINY